MNKLAELLETNAAVIAEQGQKIAALEKENRQYRSMDEGNKLASMMVQKGLAPVEGSAGLGEKLAQLYRENPSQFDIKKEAVEMVTPDYWSKVATGSSDGGPSTPGAPRHELDRWVAGLID